MKNPTYLIDNKMTKNSWFWPVFFFLLPFVSINLSFIASIYKFFPIYNISSVLLAPIAIFLALKLHKNISFYQKQWASIKKNILFGLIWILSLTTLNFLINFFFLLYGHEIGFSEIFSLPYQLVFNIYLPFLIAFSVFRCLNPMVYVANIKYVFYAIFTVCFLQTLVLFNFDFFLTDFYRDYLFRFLEGRWHGWSLINYTDESSLSFRSHEMPMVSIINRISGSLQEPSALAIFLILCPLPVFMSYDHKDLNLKSPMSRFVMILLMTIFVILTKSSTGLIGLAVLLVIYSRKNNLNLMKFLTYICFLIFALLIFIFPVFFNLENLALKLLDPLAVASSQTRFASVMAAIDMFLDYPMGVGFARHTEILVNYISQLTLNNELSSYLYNQHVTVHSLLLKILIDLGFVGFLLFFFPIISIYSRVKKTYKMGQADSKLDNCATYFFCLLFVFATSNVNYMETWFIISIAFYYSMTFKVNIKQ